MSLLCVAVFEVFLLQT